MLNPFVKLENQILTIVVFGLINLEVFYESVPYINFGSYFATFVNVKVQEPAGTYM